MEKELLVRLVGRLKQGDSTAFEPLFKEFEKTSYYVAFKMLRNEESARDVVQDTAIQVYSRIGALEDPSAFFGWVKMITANLCKRRLSKNQEVLFAPRGAQDDEDSTEDFTPDYDDSSVPHEVFDNRETRQMIRDLIDDLPDDQKLVIYMYYYQGLKIREIAEALEISENTVKSRMMYAKKKLEAGVRGYEKEGIKLYSVAPWLLYTALAEGATLLTTPVITVSVGSGAAAAAQNAAGAASAAGGSAVSAETGSIGSGISAASAAVETAAETLTETVQASAAASAGGIAGSGATAAAAGKTAAGGILNLVRTTVAGKLVAGAAVLAVVGAGAGLLWKNGKTEPEEPSPSETVMPAEQKQEEIQPVESDLRPDNVNNLNRDGRKLANLGFRKITVEYIEVPLDPEIDLGDLSSFPRSDLQNGYSIEYDSAGYLSAASYPDPVREDTRLSLNYEDDNSASLRLSKYIPTDKGDGKSVWIEKKLFFDAASGLYVDESGVPFTIDNFMCPYVYTELMETCYSENGYSDYQPYHVETDGDGRIIGLKQDEPEDGIFSEHVIRYDDQGRVSVIESVIYQAYPSRTEVGEKTLKRFAYRADGLCAGWVGFVSGYNDVIYRAYGIRFAYE